MDRALYDEAGARFDGGLTSWEARKLEGQGVSLVFQTSDVWDLP
jgi:hypothetical protein